MESSLLTEPNAAPLPNLSRTSSPSFTEDNPWAAVATHFLVSAKVSRFVHQSAKLQGLIWRSSFRSGEARLNESGIFLKGQGVKKRLWITALGVIGYILFVSAAISSTLRSKYFTLLIFEIPLIGAFLPLGAALLQEYLCFPHELFIPWNDVREFQVDTKKRWAVLVYQVASKKPGRKPSLYSLPLNVGHPALINTLADTIERYAPSKVTFLHGMTNQEKITLRVLITIAVAVFSYVICQLISVIFPP